MRVREITLRIHPKAFEGIKDHARKEAQKGEYEAVGFLAKKPKREDVHVLVPMHNHASDPRSGFFVEPWEQFSAEQRMVDRGLKPVGVYHSHVRSEALPSQADHAMARPGEFVIIYSVVFDEMRAYLEEDGVLGVVELNHG